MFWTRCLTTDSRRSTSNSHISSRRTVYIKNRKKLFSILQFLAQMTETEGHYENQGTSSVWSQNHDIVLTTDFSRSIGCPNKSARFNFVINAPFIQKVLICLFQYKVHTLQLNVEHNLRQISPTTLLSRAGRQCAHFKSCALVGTSHIWTLP